MLNSFFYLVKQGFKNLWNNRLMSLASIGVLVSCMLLIGAAALLAFGNVLLLALQILELVFVLRFCG